MQGWFHDPLAILLCWVALPARIHGTNTTDDASRLGSRRSGLRWDGTSGPIGQRDPAGIPDGPEVQTFVDALESGRDWIACIGTLLENHAFLDLTRVWTVHSQKLG